MTAGVRPRPPPRARTGCRPREYGRSRMASPGRPPPRPGPAAVPGRPVPRFRGTARPRVVPPPAAAAGDRLGTARDLPAWDCGRSAGLAAVRGAGRAGGAAAGDRLGTARDLPAWDCGRSAGLAAVRGAGRAGAAARGAGWRRCGRAAGARRAGGRWARGAGAERGAAARPSPPSRRRARCPSSAQTAGATSDSTRETARRHGAKRDITISFGRLASRSVAGTVPASSRRVRGDSCGSSVRGCPVQRAGRVRFRLQAPGFAAGRVSPGRRFGPQ